jgi:hypothetical protein
MIEYKSMRTLLLFAFVCCINVGHAQLRPFYSSENNKYGYMDNAKKIIVQPRYDLAWDFVEGMSLVRLKGKYGYINESGVEQIQPKYNAAINFSDGLAVVKIRKKYGFIDKQGNLVVPAIYDRCDNFHGDRANVCLNKKWQVMIYNPKK